MSTNKKNVVPSTNKTEGKHPAQEKKMMMSFIGSRLSVTLGDARQLDGTFLAYDRHMNLVLCDVVETKPLSRKPEDSKRSLGLVLVRGEHVVSVRAEKKGAKSESAGEAATAAKPPQVPTIPSGSSKKRSRDDD